jgi:hypothetical protein
LLGGLDSRQFAKIPSKTNHFYYGREIHCVRSLAIFLESLVSWFPNFPPQDNGHEKGKPMKLQKAELYAALVKALVEDTSSHQTLRSRRNTEALRARVLRDVTRLPHSPQF